VRPGIGIALALSLALPAAAQQSASYRLEEHVLNAGGHPEQGTILTSAHFRITLDAIGEGVGGMDLGSLSFHQDGGSASPYPPPGEVLALRFSSKQTLLWDPEASVGDYNLYRDALGTLPGLGYGVCHAQNLPNETFSDVQVPAVGAGFFYLATAENLLDEEGTKGFRSGGAERLGTVCP
jgi:hypothetical protein